jgi:Sodium / potassium ATPase beta chain
MTFESKCGDFYTRPEKLGLWKIIYNPATKKFLRRTAGSWGENEIFDKLSDLEYFTFIFTAKIITFYLIFYTVLAAFCYALWSVFLLTLPEGRPKYTDINGNTKTPGLVTRRMSMNDNSEYEFIRYNKNYAKFYIDETNTFVEGKLERTFCNL